MNLSPKLVSALLVLKNHGYERVCSAVYKEGQTTYVQFWTIDELIEAQKKGCCQ